MTFVQKLIFVLCAPVLLLGSGCQPSLNTNKGEVPYQRSKQRILNSLSSEEKTNLLACIKYLIERENQFLFIDKMHQEAARFRALQKIHRMTADQVIDYTQQVRREDEQKTKQTKLETLQAELDNIRNHIRTYQAQQAKAERSLQKLEQHFPVVTARCEPLQQAHTFQQGVRIHVEAQNACSDTVHSLCYRAALTCGKGARTVDSVKQEIELPEGLEPGEIWHHSFTRRLHRQDIEDIEDLNNLQLRFAILEIGNGRQHPLYKRHEFSRSAHRALEEYQNRYSSVQTRIQSLKRELSASHKNSGS